MSANMSCPKCGSDNVECQPKPHVHRCHACGFDGTTDSIDDLAILASALNLTIAERDAERALADDLATVLAERASADELERLWDRTKPTNMQIEVDAVLARYREARR